MRGEMHARLASRTSSRAHLGQAGVALTRFLSALLRLCLEGLPWSG